MATSRRKTDDLDDALRAWRWTRLGLDGALAGATPAKVLETSGWARSVGGAGPYLAIFARAGVGRAAVDADVAKLAVHELPAARGCTYVVPASDFALALRAGRGDGDSAEIASAKKHLGVTEKELVALGKKVLDATAKQPLDPRALKDALGDAVRNLGDAGKKRGVTTTLPLVLGRLQSTGELRRVPVNGRLDQQRYAYTRWKPPAGGDLDADELAVELARRFFRWSGPSTVAQLAWWTGLSLTACKKAIAALALVPFDGGASDGAGARVTTAADRDAIRATEVPKDPQFALVGSLDNISHMRREVAGLAGPDVGAVKVYDERGPANITALSDLPHHAILDRGRLVGFWEYDPVAEKIVWGTFAKQPAALAAAVARTEAYCREQLGDVRSFSLDSPDSRVPRLASLAKLGRGA